MAGLTFPKFPKSTIWGFCVLSRNSHTPYRRGGKKTGEIFGAAMNDLFGLEQQPKRANDRPEALLRELSK